jgi:energy-converting hydrogenase Eha subunit C
VKYGQFLFEQGKPLLESATGQAYWIAIAGLMTGALYLVAATLALALRSGAVVWIMGVQLVNTAVIMAASLANNSDLGFATLMAAICVIITTMGILLVAYLIKREEIRKP